MKETICTALGVLGSFAAGFFGGWDASIKALLLFMVIDFVLGLVCAWTKNLTKVKVAAWNLMLVGLVYVENLQLFCLL